MFYLFSNIIPAALKDLTLETTVVLTEELFYSLRQRTWAVLQQIFLKHKCLQDDGGL